MQTKHATVAWANGANLYEVNIRQYTPEGTFKAFQEHLPRLRDMGIDVLWLMPVTPISVEKRLGVLGSYYACSSYVHINPEYGTLDDFKALVNEAHALGFKLIIDWVANHTGYDHEWTTTHKDRYILDIHGNFTERNGWKDVIDLDYKNKDTHTAMIEAMQYWIKECNIDGFRCDMAHLVPLNFWKEARKACDAIKPLFWLAECDVATYHATFDVSYAWDWMHVTERMAKQEASLTDMANVLEKYDDTYPQGAKKLFFTCNHDENSWNGTEYEKYGRGASTFAVFAATWPGLPLVYSGQEIPNRRRLNFFEKDTPLEWPFQPMLHSFYKSLLTTRKRNTALQNGSQLFMLPTIYSSKILAYLQVQGSNKVLVLLNLSNDSRLRFNIAHQFLDGTYHSIFSGVEFVLSSETSFELQPWEYVVLST